MAIEKAKLGGTGRTTALAREYIQPTKVYADSNLANIADSISSIVKTVGKGLMYQQRTHDAEDKMRLVRKAQEESTDIDNAMQDASYDDDLNTKVNDWRSQGLTDTELRTNIKDYKYAKAIQDFGIDKGQETTEAIDSYFTTFTDLELKKITPLAKADRLAIQEDTADTIKSNFMVSSEDFNKVLTEAREVATTYGMDDDSVTVLAIQSAFDRDKMDDPSMLESLGSLKNSKGIRLIDTVVGRDMYNKLSDAKEARDMNRDALEVRYLAKTQEDNTNALFTDIVTTTDIASTMPQIQEALRTKSINMRQYNLLARQVDALSPSSNPYASYSDPRVLTSLQSKAMLGTLSQEDLVNYAGALKEADYKSLAKTAMDKGGLWGVGSKENDRLTSWINNTSEAESGLGFEEAFKDDLEGGMKARKLAGDIKYELGKALDNFVSTHKRLPDKEEELEKLSRDVKIRAKARLDEITKNKTNFPKANATPQQLQAYVGSGEGWQTRYTTLTMEQRAKHKAFVISQMEEAKKEIETKVKPKAEKKEVEVTPKVEEKTSDKDERMIGSISVM